MPILTMLRIGLPVWPFHSPERILFGESRHPVEHFVDLGDDVDPVDDQRGRPSACATRRAAPNGSRTR